jgi:error-prone DNA polymerase
VADTLEDLSHHLDGLSELDETFDLTFSPADGVKRHIDVDPDTGPTRRPRRNPIPRPRHPREQAKVLFPSRDFH